MAEEKTEVHEAEIVKEETALANPRVPASLEHLASLENEQGIAIMEQRGAILRTLRILSIQLTMPNDWTLFKSPEGMITGFLGDQGCDRIKKLWGIQIYNLGSMDLVKDADHEGEFAYRIKGDGKCGITGEVVEEIEGVRYSNERYALEKPEGIQRNVAVQKAARANLDGSITRELAGMKSVPVQEIDAAWAASKDIWKKTELCNHARGFGTSAERKGAQMQESSEIEVKYQPKCDRCHGPMKLIPAGTSPKGKPYAAFWGCSKDREHPTLPHEQALAEARSAKLRDEAAAATAKREPGAEG